MGTMGSKWQAPGTFSEPAGPLSEFGIRQLAGARLTMVDPPELGSGARFRALTKKLAARGDVRDPKAVAAAAGRAKYGKARFQKLAAAGRRRAK